MPGAKVNLTALVRPDGSPAYPGATAPAGTGGQAHGELTAINDHQPAMGVDVLRLQAEQALGGRDRGRRLTAFPECGREGLPGLGIVRVLSRFLPRLSGGQVAVRAGVLVVAAGGSGQPERDGEH